MPGNSWTNAGNGSVRGSRRSPAVANGNPLQYSCLGNLMDRGAWWSQKSCTRLSKGQAFLFQEEWGASILAEKNLGSDFHGDQGTCWLAVKGYYGGKGKNMGSSSPSSLLSLPPAFQPPRPSSRLPGGTGLGPGPEMSCSLYPVNSSAFGSV